MSDKLLEALRGKLRERMNEKADFVAGGGCPDYPSYTKECGVIQGLAEAERDLLDLVKEDEEA